MDEYLQDILTTTGGTVKTSTGRPLNDEAEAECATYSRVGPDSYVVSKYCGVRGPEDILNIPRCWGTGLSSDYNPSETRTAS